MREILFRGKPIHKEDYTLYEKLYKSDVFKDGFAYGSLVVIKDKYYICIGVAGVSINSLINNATATLIEVIPEIVGEYINLTDCHDKMIFEGDIIRYADNDEYESYLESLKCPEGYEGVNFSKMWTVDEVVYGDKIGYPAFDLNTHDFDCNGLAELNESGGQWFYEIIGNIHDNPELLEEKE